MKIQSVVSLFLLTLIFCFTAKAQQNSSVKLVGGILDLQGAVIPFINVSAISKSKIIFTVQTDGDGVFSLDLPVGIYDLEFNRQIIKYNAFDFVEFKNYRIVPAYDGKINLDIPLGIVGNGVICLLDVSDTSTKIKGMKKHASKKKIYKKEK